MEHPLYRRPTALGRVGKSGPEAEELVVNAVVDAVLAQRLKPGDRLIERALSEVCGVGRMAVRNALLRLANAGLVELCRNRGAVIIQVSDVEARQIFEARIVVEEATLRALAHAMDARGLTRLRGLVAKEARLYGEGRMEAARRVARDLHAALVELAGNQPLARFHKDLMNCQQLLSPHRGGRPSTFSGVPLHEETVEALARRDGDAAAAANTALLRQLQAEMELDRAQAAAGPRTEAEEAGKSAGSAPRAAIAGRGEKHASA